MIYTNPIHQNSQRRPSHPLGIVVDHDWPAPIVGGWAPLYAEPDQVSLRADTNDTVIIGTGRVTTSKVFLGV